MKKIFFGFCFLFFLSSCGVKKWSYENQEKWGESSENKFCKIGYNQSPIDVKYDFSGGDLQFFYNNSEVEKKYLDYALRAEFFGKNYVSRKRKYFVRYLDFHHPSEHLLNGEQQILEMQILHKSDDEQWLILAIFLEMGKLNSKFDELINFLESKKSEGKIDLRKIVNMSDQAFFYDGSFTTPPCREGVKWYVMKTPIQISKEQMNRIIKSAILVKSNARKIQEFHPEKF